MEKIEKKVKNLTVYDYNVVEDMIAELLEEQFGITGYSVENLERNKVYIVGAINFLRLGDKPNTLQHKQQIGDRWCWSEDIEVSPSYEFATYYEAETFKQLCTSTLSGSHSETYAFNKVMKKMENHKS